MGQPAARFGDAVTGVDIHIIMTPSPGGPVPTPTPHPFSGTIDTGCVSTVKIGGQPAAVMGSGCTNMPPHLPIGAGPFGKPPTNRGTIAAGSATVFIGKKPAARLGDSVITCNDPADAPTSTVTGGAPTVMIG